jgi:hypothetical protein
MAAAAVRPHCERLRQTQPIARALPFYRPKFRASNSHKKQLFATGMGKGLAVF